MDCFAALAMTSKHTFATSRRDASESVGWVEPSAKPIGYANCDDGYRWRSTHPTSHVNGQAIPVDGGLTASMPYAGKPI